MSRSAIRWYSEAEHTFGPPADPGYGTMRRCAAYGEPHPSLECGCEIVPVRHVRDTRMWLSIEDAARRGIAVPDNWRELT